MVSRQFLVPGATAWFHIALNVEPASGHALINFGSAFREGEGIDKLSWDAK